MWLIGAFYSQNLARYEGKGEEGLRSQSDLRFTATSLTPQDLGNMLELSSGVFHREEA